MVKLLRACRAARTSTSRSAGTSGTSASRTAAPLLGSLELAAHRRRRRHGGAGVPLRARTRATRGCTCSTSSTRLRRRVRGSTSARRPMLGPPARTRARLGAAGEDPPARPAHGRAAPRAGAGRRPGFAPEPVTALYQRSLYSSLRRSAAHHARRGCAASSADLRRPARGRWPSGSLAAQDGCSAGIDALRDRRSTAMRIPTHGDYHLGQVLFTGRDFVIIDFEGEPGRADRRAAHQAPAAARRRRHAALLRLRGARGAGRPPATGDW